MKKQIELQKALALVTKHINKDMGYFHAWQSNIAMAFKDEYRRIKEKKKYINYNDLHLIANHAAMNFLNQLIRTEKKKKKWNTK